MIVVVDPTNGAYVELDGLVASMVTLIMRQKLRLDAIQTGNVTFHLNKARSQVKVAISESEVDEAIVGKS